MNNEPDAKITGPHDGVFKKFFTNRETALSFLQEYLPPEIRDHLDLDTLKISKDSFLDDKLAAKASDLLYEVELNGAPFFLYLLFEHKSYQDPLVAFQVLKYMIRIWELFLRQQKKAKKLPGIFPMLIYHGKTGWNVDKSFRALIDTPKELIEHLGPYMPDYQYRVYDLSDTPDEEIKGEILLKILLKTLKYVFHGDFSERLVGILDLFTEIIDKKKCTEYLEVLLRYISKGVPSITSKQLRDSIERSKIDGGEIMPTIEQELMKKGEAKGEAKVRMKIAAALLRKGIPLKTVIETTDLSEKEIEKLQPTVH